MSGNVNPMDFDIAKELLRKSAEEILGLLSLTSVQAMDVLQSVVDEMRPKAIAYEKFDEYWIKGCDQ